MSSKYVFIINDFSSYKVTKLNRRVGITDYSLSLFFSVKTHMYPDYPVILSALSIGENDIGQDNRINKKHSSGK
ncbi:MAG: hypothetical protein CVV03_11975 [Firmicutes bacterium HGW-Firmicutes-8]|nr:MAG: hypothetical protein CVV03_11975 [Firmicutes bacterium HGW-Firmicutes-8]